MQRITKLVYFLLVVTLILIIVTAMRLVVTTVTQKWYLLNKYLLKKDKEGLLEAQKRHDELIKNSAQTQPASNSTPPPANPAAPPVTP